MGQGPTPQFIVVPVPLSIVVVAVIDTAACPENELSSWSSLVESQPQRFRHALSITATTTVTIERARPYSECASSIARTASSNTCAPASLSFCVIDSASLWLNPPAHGTKIIDVGTTLET
jgi:hypothetical protein